MTHLKSRYDDKKCFREKCNLESQMNILDART